MAISNLCSSEKLRGSSLNLKFDLMYFTALINYFYLIRLKVSDLK